MLSVKVPKETEDRLERLALRIGRSKSFCMRAAIDRYLEENEWQVAAISEAVAAADAPNAKFVDHDKVADWLSTWGTAHETEPPKCG